MRDVRDIVAFRSRRFVPILPEACQVRPRTYGAELAFWLAGKLAGQGIVTSYPVMEEGSWVLAYRMQGGVCFRIMCTNIDGSDEHWRLSLKRHDVSAHPAAPSPDTVQALVNAIRFVLHAAVVKEDIDWRYDAPTLTTRSLR
ncbi:MAG: hypothetical protein V7631_2871 [Massilia sp.]|jgi:hypothetical protein